MIKVIKEILVDAVKDSIKDFIKDRIKVLLTLLPQVFNLAGLLIPLNDSTSWLHSLPPLYWFIFSVIIFSSFITVATIKSINSSHEQSRIAPASLSSPPYGWEELTRSHYENVVWIVQRDSRGPDARRVFPRKDPRPSQIRIGIPARCPKCGTELKEKHLFLGGFLRYCIKCDFKIKSKFSFHETSKDVEILARNEVEKTTGFSSDY
ncbi:MAG: hypothetical protein A2889_01250 [Nitrospinae bacterium RIFCSPLOWO2_01_FULL_39_10]|nr:MAG: hypothetical protein A2889_01250 [Nitrospinae bacterium RIFCSPLOWO2_01_FULL_39_10]